MVIALVVTALAAPPSTSGVPAASPALQSALVAELDRVPVLKLPGEVPPYFVAYDVLDGDVRTALAEDGGFVRTTLERFRNLRVEVRVGDYQLDSTNFSAFGEPDGVVSRRLPVADDEVALRREVWLATDSAYKQAVEQLSRKQAARQANPEPRPADFSPAPALVREPGEHPGNALSESQVQSYAAALSAAATMPGIESAQAVVRDWHGWRTLVTTEGTRATVATGNVVIRVEATVRRPDGTRLSDAAWWIEGSANQLPSLEVMVGEVRAFAKGLSAAALAAEPSPYLGPVLFEGIAATELFSQLLAAEFVGTPLAESDDGEWEAGGPTAARVGRRLLPDGWRVFDDPSSQTGAAGEYGFDHEGVAPRRVDLVVDGVLRDVLMSRIPSLSRTQSSGHGRSLGENRRSAMPGYVRILPKSVVSTSRLRQLALREAAQVGLDRVLVVSRIRPPPMTEQLDITFSGEGPPAGLTAPYAACFLSKDGTCTPARNLKFSGVDRRSLRDVVAAGPGAGPVNMLDGAPGPERFSIGSTGGIPTTWDTPSVLVGEVELEPSGAGEPRVLRWE